MEESGSSGAGLLSGAEPAEQFDDEPSSREDETNEMRMEPVVAVTNFQQPNEAVQYWANLVAHLLCLCALFAVFRWVTLLGGLSWEEGEAKIVFNWHPLLMIMAFCFMTVASLSFRFPYRSAVRGVTKLIHGIAWLVAAVTATVALVAVFKSHNDAASGYIANLYSLHSWVGITVVVAYVLQFSIGAYGFWWSSNPALKATVLQFHTIIGPLLYVAVSVTILLGIQEKEGFVGCSYKVTHPDTFFPPQFREIPPACKVSHTLGLLVFLTMISTFIALHNASNNNNNVLSRRDE